MRICNMWCNSILFLLIPLTLCLRITKVYVPSLVDVRGQAELRCIFDLETSRLNSVKWYKDDSEFFRYVPQPPHIYTFDVTGVHVEKTLSTMSVVTLSPLRYSSTGSYVCEVSTEAPLFSLDKGGSNMTVIGIPKTDPRIEGVSGVYPVGEYINANCTTAPSRPPANVEWRINGKQASEWLIERYRLEPVEKQDEYGLQSRSVGLRFQLEEKHFQRHVLNLTCIASVQGIVKRTSVSVSSPQFHDVNNYAHQNFAFGWSRSAHHQLSAILAFSVPILTKFCL